uniref:Secreted protein n=1 Tax=Knipowitschia caucasica TaxID=637954 RepID=A0AAV2MTC9_KNICA
MFNLSVTSPVLRLTRCALIGCALPRLIGGMSRAGGGCGEVSPDAFSVRCPGAEAAPITTDTYERPRVRTASRDRGDGACCSEPEPRVKPAYRRSAPGDMQTGAEAPLPRGARSLRGTVALRVAEKP